MYLLLLDAAVVYNAGFGHGTGQIWLSDLHCDGHEERLIECRRLPLGSNSNCGHNHDVGVICNPSQ